MVSPIPQTQDSERSVNADEAQGPESPYLRSLVRDGVSIYVGNAHARMEFLHIDGMALPDPVPVLVPEVRARQTHLVSPLAHYVYYTGVEVAKRNPAIPRWIIDGGIGAYTVLQRLLGLDRVVYVNNWLFSTNLDHNLSSDQIRAVTDELIARYPDRAIIYSTVNPKLNRPLYDNLLGNGCEPTLYRTAYLMDCRENGWRKKRNNEIDQKILRESPYEVITNDQIRDEEAEVLARLYHQVYLLRHTSLNADLTPELFKLTLRDPSFHYRALRKDGTIHAFVSWVMHDGIMVSGTLGYDISAPREDGLYRQVMAILVREAGRRRVMMNMSGGAGDFKTLRGAVATPEYEAVYDRHLPAHRRLAWKLVRLQSKVR